MSISEGSTRRKSTRVKKLKNTSLLDDFPEDVLAVTEMEKEDKMPEGWNPSDDSEDDYNPLEEKVTARKRNEPYDSDEEHFTKKSRKSESSRRQFSRSSVKSDPDLTDTCVICHKDVMKSEKSVTSNLKFHYAQEHYYPDGSFLKIAPPAPSDLEEDQLLPRDCMGEMFR